MRPLDNTTTSFASLGPSGKKLMISTALTAAGLLCAASNANAANDWTNHVATSGGSISIDTSTPDTTNITQTGSRVTVSGDGDIKGGWTVNVAQPSSASQYILFDTEADPTHIRGNLNANGEIWIFDQNGVIFGANSAVDVASLVTSTAGTFASITDEDGTRNVFSNFGDGEIVNRGTITVADAGLAAFVAPTVKNSGVIKAKMGKVIMAAGETVTLDMYGDGLVEVAVNGALSDGLIKNTGDIIARGGEIIMKAEVAKDAVDNVINLDGLVTASSASVQGGKIVLSGGSAGTVKVKGRVNASGNGTAAGSVDISGERIHVTDTARVRADGDATNAAGEINAIADDELTIDGRLSAQGLADTGFIETSAPTTIFGSGASILATREWLLDPTDVDINAGSIIETLIEAQLGVGDMTVETPAGGTDAGNIAVRTVINWLTTNTFKLVAANDVFLSAAGGGINAVGGGSFVVEAGDDFRMNAGNNGISTNGGNVHITAGDEVTIDGGGINAGGGNITFDNSESFRAIAESVRTSGTGTIEINQNKDVNGNTVIATPTIQNAIDAILNTGTGTNTINVGAGTWAESVNVDHDNVVLKGANAGLHGSDGARGPETIVTPNSPGFYVTADNATIDGFTVDGSGASGNNGIEVDGVNNFKGINNVLINNTDTGAGRSASNWTTGIGVLVKDSTGTIEIADNRAEDNTDGIRILDTDATALGDVKIKGNDVVDNGDKGIITKNSDRIQIIDNDITENRTGIWLENSSENVVRDNIIDDSSQNAIRLRNNSDNNVIRDNRIDGAGDNGILVAANSDNVVIRNNRIRNVDENGIDLDGSDNARIINNRINSTGDDAIDLDDSVNARIIGNRIGLADGADNIGDDGIDLDDSNGAVIRDNRIRNTKENGIDLDDSDNARIVANVINDTGDDGIDLDRSDEARIIDNRIGLAGGANNIGDDGIDLDDSDNALIKGNKVKNTTENGLDIRNSNGTTMRDNIVRVTGGHGIYVNPSDNIRILDNTITDTGEDGVHVEEGYDVRVRRNTIRRTGDDGIDITRNDFVRVTDNTVTDTDKRGISIERSKNDVEDFSVVAADNTVRRTGRTGIVVDRFTTARVVDNTVTDSNRAGIRVQRGDEARIRRNTVRDTRRDGIKAVNLDSVDIRRNLIRRAGWDGVHLEDFGSAWIAYNDIKWTGDDGIDATNGDFVSIYDNYIDLSGFMPAEFFGNEEVGDDANGIYVSDVGEGELPPLSLDAGFGYGYYGTSVEIHGNDVANAEDDGIQVEDSDSTYIGFNIVGHTGDDGIDIDDVDYVKVSNNAVTLAADKGITIDGGNYAGVFDNRVLLTGNDGIQVENVRYDHDTDITILGDDGYGYGWAVNVSGNEVAMTGDDGIEVRNSDATKVQKNKVFMAGMGRGLRRTIDTINDFASETFDLLRVARPSVPSYEGFEWYWGDGHGINVHGIDGAYYSPNGWAADIRGNKVKYTGGHGILAEGNDRTRIKNNRVRHAGIEETYFGGASSMMEALNSGPFHSEGRRDLWMSTEESMIAVLEDYFGIEEPEYETDYITFDYIDYDSHDGIHAENIYGESLDGLSGRDYLFDLKIKNNDVRRTGDDGIEVVYAGRTLIAKNTVRHAGYGDDRDYGSGDYYGADGIHARYISGSVYGYPDSPGLGRGGREPASNYALIIRGNDVRNTADDGIEVVGRDGQPDMVAISTAGIGYPPYYFGETDRVLIKNNTIRRSGVVNNFGFYKENLGPDGYGHDGIHVRGINGQSGPIWPVMTLAGPGPVPGEGGYGYYGYAVDVIDNDVRRTGDDGIEVINSSSTLILGNTVRRAGVGGGIYYGGGDYFGADGIHVRNVGDRFGGPIWSPGLAGPAGIGFKPYSVVITENDVRKTADDGIEVVGNAGPRFMNAWGDGGDGGDGWPSPIRTTGRTLISQNDVHNAGYGLFEGDGGDGDGLIDDGYGYGAPDGYGADGIHVRGVGRQYYGDGGDGDGCGAPTVGLFGDALSFGDFDVEISDNYIWNSADDGVEVRGRSFAQTNILVDRNTIEESGDNGILIASADDRFKPKDIFRGSSVLLSPIREVNSIVSNNEVSNSGSNGLHIEGAAHNDVIVSGNTFTNNDTGALFESGTIDLTGDGNTFVGGNIGMRFAPAPLFYYPTAQVLDDAPSILPPMFAPMSLVDNTIGSQTFNGQSASYVELDNGAFFNPGTPTLLNALDSTYVGTPFGTFTPSSDFPTGLPLDVVAYLESKFVHFNDNGTTGLFFFPLLPGIAQEDIFNYFGPYSASLSGLNVTILGLPGIPGGSPVALNNIAPAAGGDASPEALNAIATAAGEEGGETSSCWGDAIGAAGSGQTATLSYGGSAEELLSGEASCGS